MELRDDQMRITTDDGVEHIVNILFTYDNEERGTSYVVFTEEGNDDDVMVMSYKEGSDELQYVEDEEELGEVEEVLNAFLDEQEKEENN